jgi:hypothetical protein
MLAFIDVPPGTMFLPQAAELDCGRVVTFFDALTERLQPRWIDYKMTFATGDELNLHVIAYGDYDTGVLAYNLIRRGWRYGLRIVGSLKSQPALNVLAIYDK